MKILHLTDLHPTARETGQESGLRSATRTQAMVSDLRNRATGEFQNTIVVISGDLMDERTDPNVNFAKEQIRLLREKFVVIVCPGNHDYYLPSNRTAQTGLGRSFWNEFMLPMRDQTGVQWKTPLAEVDYPVQLDVGDNLSFLILDSNADAQGEKTFGELGREQREKLVGRISAIPANRRLVTIVHHDPIYVGPVKSKLGSLLGRSPALAGKDRRALKNMLKTRAAELLLCGHTHDPRVYVGADAAEWNLRAASNGGTSTGHENDEGDLSESPFWLFDLDSPDSPTKVQLPWV